jgi:hypothetical protein
MKTIINKQSGKVLFASADWIDTETEIGIDEILTESFVVPYFNQETRVFYEGATQEEINQANRQQVQEEVQLWRIRTILKVLGMEQVVEIALESLQEPQKTGALYIWNYGTTVERNSQTVQLLQSVLGLTSEQVDDIFIQAQNIQL